DADGRGARRQGGDEPAARDGRGGPGGRRAGAPQRAAHRAHVRAHRVARRRGGVRRRLRGDRQGAGHAPLGRRGRDRPRHGRARRREPAGARLAAACEPAQGDAGEGRPAPPAPDRPVRRVAVRGRGDRVRRSGLRHGGRARRGALGADRRVLVREAMLRPAGRGERGDRRHAAGRGRARRRPAVAPPRRRVDAPAGAGSAVRRRSDRPRPAADALAEGRGGDGVVTDPLYELLPPLYRVRDVESGGALKALLEVLEREADVVEGDIEGLYKNWFIETCDPWVVAYIGDLLGVRRLHPVGPGTGSLRAYVANTLGYRRRKGTVAVLEQLAYDVTGWRARAVEFFQLLETAQDAKHVRLHNLRTPDLRDANALELLDGPFERAAHTAEVRRIASGRGRYNLPNVGIFVWRLESYPLEHVSGRRVGAAAEGRFAVHPLGLDAPLF